MLSCIHSKTQLSGQPDSVISHYICRCQRGERPLAVSRVSTVDVAAKVLALAPDRYVLALLGNCKLISCGMQNTDSSYLFSRSLAFVSHSLRERKF